MPIDLESFDNFQRGGIGDTFLGIANLHNKTIYLSLAQSRDGRVVPSFRYSRVNGIIRKPLSNRSGYGAMVRWLGLPVRHMRSDYFDYRFVGFTFVKAGPSTVHFGAVRSLAQLIENGVAPKAKTSTGLRPRTLIDKDISDRVAHELKFNLILQMSDSGC